MSNQTTMNGNASGKHSSRPEQRNSVVANIADVLHDATELAELQVKLLVTDMNATLRKSSISLFVLTIAGCLLLGLIPIALLAFAELLVHGLGWSRPIALITAAALGLLLATVTGAIGAIRFQRSLTELNNSRAELERNLNWIKKTLKTAA